MAVPASHFFETQQARQQCLTPQQPHGRKQQASITQEMQQLQQQSQQGKQRQP